VPDEPWVVDVYWQAEVAPKADFYARLSLVDGDGQTRWIWDAAPLVSFYPTSRWEAGEVVRSQMSVIPSFRTPGGEYNLVLTLLDEASRPIGQVQLGRVRVEGRLRSFATPTIDVTVGAVFGDAIELVGYNLQSPVSNLHPGDELAVNMVWRALARVETDYTITLQLLGPDGRVYGQKDAAPAGGDAPTSTWSPGEVLRDPYRFTVASDAPPGDYQLIVAMYLIETGERTPVRGGGDVVTLGQLEVTPTVP
jgi:hypothetical protein